MRISDWSSDVCSADRLATRQPPQAVLDRLRKAGIKAAPTGLAHGTITAVIDSGPVEVTTLRRDVSTDGRHAIVDYTDDWREDAARREFTINALYADPLTGALFDYFGGLAALVAGPVRSTEGVRCGKWWGRWGRYRWLPTQ